MDRSGLGKYLLSLPERVLRSASALAGGLTREIGNVTLPAAVRRTSLYRTMVEATLRFMIEDVGQVEGVYPAAGALAKDFLFRKAAGHGIEWVGILAFRASPARVPENLLWLSNVSRSGMQRTSELFAHSLLDHYSDTLRDIRAEGVTAWWTREFTPYLRAAADQFSPRRVSLMQRILRSRSSR